MFSAFSKFHFFFYHIESSHFITSQAIICTVLSVLYHWNSYKIKTCTVCFRLLYDHNFCKIFCSFVLISASDTDSYKPDLDEEGNMRK